MTLVEDKRAGGFTFTWSIHNFSYCVKKESEYLDSPEFGTALLGDTKWYLLLYPRGDDAPGFISYYLCRYKNYPTIKFALSIRSSNGIFKEMGEQTHSVNHKGYQKYISLNELKGPESYLDNDTLTLRCRMWKNDTDLLASVNWYAHTKIKVIKLDYMWILNEIVDSNNDSQIIETKLNQSMNIPILQIFKIRLLHGGTFGDDAIHFGIEKENDNKRIFLTFVVHILDAEGGIAHSVHSERLFECSSQTHVFSFMSKRELLSKVKLYLPNGKLTLRCELSVSTGAVNSEFERFEYRKTNAIQLKTSAQKQVLNLTEHWKGNMQRIYEEGKFSDVTVRTPNRQFPVHKAIICAQSEVFSAMFECDMTENRTGVVEIEDLEDDTVSKMLIFLYTNTLEDLDFSMACKLYFAADKYQITVLRRMCSNYLIQNLDTSNVCDALSLADTHQDEELKSVAWDFIFVHDFEIINSEYWKKLMEAKSQLTSETMQLMICKKFLGNLKP